MGRGQTGLALRREVWFESKKLKLSAQVRWFRDIVFCDKRDQASSAPLSVNRRWGRHREGRVNGERLGPDRL